MTINYTCKICHKPGTVELRPEEVWEAAWMDTFKKMLVCNPCYDLRNKFRKAEGRIIGACVTLARLKLMRAGKDVLTEAREACRNTLMTATRRYAEALAVYRKLSEPIWSLELVEKLLEAPHEHEKALREYRASLKRVFVETSLPMADVRATAPDP
jgi:hypothetical protein